MLIALLKVRLPFPIRPSARPKSCDSGNIYKCINSLLILNKENSLSLIAKTFIKLFINNIKFSLIAFFNKLSNTRLLLNKRQNTLKK
jgi:hypothetical protein